MADLGFGLCGDLAFEFVVCGGDDGASFFATFLFGDTFLFEGDTFLFEGETAVFCGGGCLGDVFLRFCGETGCSTCLLEVEVVEVVGFSLLLLVLMFSWLGCSLVSFLEEEEEAWWMGWGW